MSITLAMTCIIGCLILPFALYQLQAVLRRSARVEYLGVWLVQQLVDQHLYDAQESNQHKGRCNNTAVLCPVLALIRDRLAQQRVELLPLHHVVSAARSALTACVAPAEQVVRCLLFEAIRYT